MKKLNSLALVSGASSGIGEAICRLLIEQQYRVVAVARKPCCTRCSNRNMSR